MAKLTFTPHDPNKINMTVKENYHQAQAHEFKEKHHTMKQYFLISLGSNIILTLFLIILEIYR